MRYYILTAIISLSLCTSSIFGQGYGRGESSFLLGVNGGYTYPLGDFGKLNKNGIGGNLSAKYLINQVIGIGFEGGYHTFKSKISGNENVSQDYKCSLIPILLEATFYIPTWDRTVLPYFGLHFGAYLTRVQISQKPAIYGEPSVSKKLTLFSPGGGPDAGILIELSEFVKLDIKIRGDFVPKIEDEYSIDEYSKGNIGFNKMFNIGANIGLLYTF